MKKIILDTDPGVDDAMAIAYALTHPEIELMALTVVFGNINIDFATRNAQYILNELGATDVAVAKGAAIPSVQSPLPHADFVHGSDGLGNAFSGDSCVIDPAGEVVFSCGGAPAVHTERLSAELLHSYRESFPAWKDADRDLPV